MLTWDPAGLSLSILRLLAGVVLPTPAGPWLFKTSGSCSCPGLHGAMEPCLWPGGLGWVPARDGEL